MSSLPAARYGIGPFMAAIAQTRADNRQRAEQLQRLQKTRTNTMPRSVHSMMRHGLISTKAYNATLAKTRSQKSKMAEFSARGKDDGDAASGKLKAGEINAAEHQRASAAGVVRKPNATAHGGPPRTGPNHINKPSNKKMFPPGGTAPGKGGIPPTPARVRGTKHQSGPMVGSGQK